MLHFKKVIFCTGIAMLLNLHLLSQDLVCLTDPDSVSTHTNSKTYFGDEHTPRGSLKVLVIFCRTLSDTAEEANWGVNDLPDWAYQQFDSSEGSIGNSLNISKYYYDLSKLTNSPFKITGKIFPQMIVTPDKISSQVIDSINANYPNYNALSREEALRGMTIWAAFSNFEEGEKGSLERGKVADFVVLEEDIMKIPAHRLHGVKVLATYIGGERAFARDEE